MLLEELMRSVELFAEYFLCLFFSLGGLLYRCTIGLNKETTNHG